MRSSTTKRKAERTCLRPGSQLYATSKAAARIAARIEHVTAGLFGDCKPVAEGVWELRVHWGPGYRVYYAQSGRRVVLLLCGGDKRQQKADIKRAIASWQDWKRGTT